MPLSFTRLEIPDVILIETAAFSDPRGFFAEGYKRSDFNRSGLSCVFVQDNYSRSIRGVLRGLHYQKAPVAQGKLVSVIRGEIFDVAVDIRKGSPTFGRWIAATLSDQNHRMLFIPEGFAHGFCVVSDEADVVYKTTMEYTPALEGGIIWNDRELNIPWPVKDPILSPRDARLPGFTRVAHEFFYKQELV